MNLAKVRQDIVSWINDFVTVGNENLNNWQPCPFARKTLVQKKFDIRLGTDVAADCKFCAETWSDTYEVVIYAYEQNSYDSHSLSGIIEDANCKYNKNDLLFLEDHPADKEIVNGVVFNQGQYILVLVQRLSTVNAASSELEQLGYYKLWPKDYYDKVVGWREQSGFDDN